MRQPSALNGIAGDSWIQIQVSNAVATCVSRKFCARHGGMKLQYIYRHVTLLCMILRFGCTPKDSNKQRCRYEYSVNQHGHVPDPWRQRWEALLSTVHDAAQWHV